MTNVSLLLILEVEGFFSSYKELNGARKKKWILKLSLLAGY